MLAQNFMTAADLGLTTAQRAALVKVLGMLERGELVHNVNLQTDTEFGFNMQYWDNSAAAKANCGTVLCLGGWANFFGGDFQRSERFDEIGKLFYPSRENLAIVNWENITPTQAATALRNYLTTGRAEWKAVLG